MGERILNYKVRGLKEAEKPESKRLRHGGRPPTLKLPAPFRLRRDLPSSDYGMASKPASQGGQASLSKVELVLSNLRQTKQPRITRIKRISEAKAEDAQWTLW